MSVRYIFAAAALAMLPSLATARDIGGVACTTPPPARCDGLECTKSPVLAERGNAIDAKTGRQFFLDYPCNLKADEKILFILNLHGAGSTGNWQRHYFPAANYRDKYRVVVATPTAATSAALIPGVPDIRRWDAAADDEHLQNITDFVLTNFGRANIKSFWLAGHSQGGVTSRRIVCSAYFKDKVDGWLSLSGGRITQAPLTPAFGPPKADGSPPAPRSMAAAMAGETMPTCDFSHIYAIGEHEIQKMPDTSAWATRFGCGAAVRREDIVDTKPGHVWDYQRAGYKVWGLAARPGTARIVAYPACKDGRIVMDVERLDKGHTEGLEPKVTEALVGWMASTPGGKLLAAR